MAVRLREVADLTAAMTEARYQLSVSSGVRRERWTREIAWLSRALAQKETP